MNNIFTFILLLTVLKGYSQEADTAEIYFDYNVARFSDASSRRLDSFRFARILVPGHKTTVYGYTDCKGTDDYNKQLSIARAKNVKNYLVSLGLDEHDIVHCEGKGKARTDQEQDKDRKVLIIMERAPSKYAKAKEAAAAKEAVANATKSKTKTPKTDALNPADSTGMAGKVTKPAKTKTPKAGTQSPADSAAMAVKTAKTKTPKTGTLSPTDSAATAVKTAKTKTPKTGTLSPADSAAMAAKKASRDSAAMAAKAAKKANADAAALAAKAAKKTSADSAALAAKAAKKASVDAAMAAKAAKKASADSAAMAAKAAKKANADAALAAKAAKKASADSAAMAAKMAKPTTPKAGGTHPADSTGMAKTTKPKNPKTGSHNTSDSTGKIAKTKDPKSDGSKPGTQTSTGTSTGNAAADGTAPVPLVLGENMENTAAAPVDGTANTAGTQPPVAAGTVVHPKIPAPEAIVPLPKDAKVKRKAEKNIATLDPKNLIIGEIIPLNNIYFAPASNEMLRQSEPSLELLFKFLKTNTNLAVEIQGRICCLNPIDGTDEPDGNGSTRSTARAKNIYDYLVTKGIEKSRLSYSGLGNTKPSVYPEKTEFDRDLNRRATMKIIYK